MSDADSTKAVCGGSETESNRSDANNEDINLMYTADTPQIHSNNRRHYIFFSLHIRSEVSQLLHSKRHAYTALIAH